MEMNAGHKGLAFEGRERRAGTIPKMNEKGMSLRNDRARIGS